MTEKRFNPNQQIESRNLPEIHPQYDEIISVSKFQEEYFPQDGELIEKTIEHIIHNISSTHRCGIQNVVVTFEKSDKGHSYAGFYIISKNVEDEFSIGRNYSTSSNVEAKGLKRHQSEFNSGRNIKRLISAFNEDFERVAKPSYPKYSHGKEKAKDPQLEYLVSGFFKQ